MIAAGGCDALVAALRITEDDITRSDIALTMSHFAKIEEGRAALIAAGACGVLTDALRISEIDATRGNIALTINLL